MYRAIISRNIMRLTQLETPQKRVREEGALKIQKLVFFSLVDGKILENEELDTFK